MPALTNLSEKGDAYLIRDDVDLAEEIFNNTKFKSSPCCGSPWSRQVWCGYRIGVVVLSLIVCMETILLGCLGKTGNCQDQLQTVSQQVQMKTTTQMYNESDSVNAVDSLNTICFPCGTLGPNIKSNDTGNVFIITEISNLCCINDAGNLKKLFLLMINEYYRTGRGTKEVIFPENSNSTDREKDDPEIGAVSGTNEDQPKSIVPSFWQEREDAAHMFLDNQLLKQSNKTVQRIPWDGVDGKHLSVAKHRVIYNSQNRSLEVLDYGLYFVYSSVTFKSPDPTDKTASVYHMLLKEHPLLPRTGETMLMMNKFGGGKHSQGFYTSFLCGTFRVRHGDRIFVRVSNISFLYPSYYSNYIGMYRL